MGALIYSIELLTDAIDDYLKNKEVMNGHAIEFAETFGWKIKNRINELMEIIGTTPLDMEYISRIQIQIKRISTEETFSTLVKN